MKIQKIEVRNYKSISEQEMDLNGCSAIITAGNDKGKTSLSRGIIDRFQGEKPDLIVKVGESKGINIMKLTDGSIIEWSFTEKTESFKFITKDGFIVKTGVLKAIGEKYFGQKFDIDQFLNSQPKQQIKELQKLVGIDFTEIENKYHTAYDIRKYANRIFQEISSKEIKEPEKIERPAIDEIKKELNDIKIKNSELKEQWIIDNEKHIKDIQEFNSQQIKRRENIQGLEECLIKINEILLDPFITMFDFEQAKKYISELPKPEEQKEIKNLSEPNYLSESDLQKKLDDAYEKMREFDNYQNKLNDYYKFIEDYKEAKKNALDADEKVKEIEKKKQELIKSANLPEEFKINDDGILYNGYPLNNNQISTSSKYIAALKLGSLVLGEIKTLHFEASSLDKNSLKEVQEWAEKNDLQLLIERPDFDGGEITYEILNY